MDKTYDKSHRLHAMHYNIDLVVITTSSVYCDHKEKQQQANRQIKHQTSKPKKQMKKRNEKKQRINKKIITGFEPWTFRCRVLGVTPRLHRHRY